MTTPILLIKYILLTSLFIINFLCTFLIKIFLLIKFLISQKFGLPFNLKKYISIYLV